MTAREYLERPEAIGREILRKRVRADTLRRMATRFSAGISDVRVQVSPDPSRMQEFLAEAADEESEIAQLEQKREQAAADAALLISRLPEEKMARIMELRYLDRWPWEDIIDELDCCASHVYRLHQLALDILTPPPETED